MLSMKRGNLDSIAVSLFADIFIELTNTVSDGKIQITILILRRGPCLRRGCRKQYDLNFVFRCFEYLFLGQKYYLFSAASAVHVS